MKKILKEILKNKKKEVESLKVKRPLSDFLNSKLLLRDIRSFKEAITSGNSINLIAEIKKKSPSKKKEFFKKLDVSHLAKIYEKNGAKAISVLTDKKFFGGDPSYINKVKQAVKLPVLRKDFIISEYQVYESRYLGADAILLIARILTKEQIRSFSHLARRIGMECLVEVYDEKDLENALVAGAKIIGINNRNLDALTIDLENTFRVVSKMPKEIIKISESGIKSNSDIVRLKKIGINAVLIGSSFLESSDIEGKMKDIMKENK